MLDMPDRIADLADQSEPTPRVRHRRDNSKEKDKTGIPKRKSSKDSVLAGPTGQDSLRIPALNRFGSSTTNSTASPAFSLSTPHRSSAGCSIPLIQHRGITLRQLQKVLASAKRLFKQSVCEDEAGDRIVAQNANLYHIVHWIVKPQTQTSLVSYVELIADGVQRPEWFVSHWWGECHQSFISCLNRHFIDRGLLEDHAYWVCAYAINQWTIAEDLGKDLELSSFMKAMKVSRGIVSVIDQRAVCYSRIWCCFEVWAALVYFGFQCDHMYDIYTHNGDNVVGITDGAAAVDFSAGPGNATYNKAVRERTFPPKLVLRALSIEVEQAEASSEEDKARILEVVTAGVEGEGKSPVNNLIHGRFAAAGWRRALELGMAKGIFQSALSNSRLRKLSFSFYGCPEMTDGALAALLQALPNTLEVLILDLCSCGNLLLAEFRDVFAVALGRLSHQLQRFDLALGKCPTPFDEGIGALIQGLNVLQPAKCCEEKLQNVFQDATETNSIEGEWIEARRGRREKHSPEKNLETAHDQSDTLQLPLTKDNVAEHDGEVDGDDASEWTMVCRRKPNVAHTDPPKTLSRRGSKESVAASSRNQGRRGNTPQDVSPSTGLGAKTTNRRSTGGASMNSLIDANLASAAPENNLADGRSDRASAMRALSLRLERCGGLSACTAESLGCALFGMQVLQVIHVDFTGCECLSDSDVDVIARGLPVNTIEEMTLVFARCVQLGPLALGFLANALAEANALRRLQLNFSGCSRVSSEAALRMVGKLPLSLQDVTLHFRTCPHVGSQGRMEIERACKRRLVAWKSKYGKLRIDVKT